MLAFRVCVIVLIALACDVSQPLPPPQLPASQLLSCRAKGCPEGEVCHAAIGTGQCAPACSDDAFCAEKVAGYVCHPQLGGGTCAPSCTSNDVCESSVAGTVCVDGLCAPNPAAGLATIRVLNTLGADTVPVVRAGAQLVAALGPTELSDPLTIAAGAPNLSFGTEATFNVGTFVSGRTYLVVLWRGDLGYRATAVQMSSAVTLADRASIAFVNASLRVFPNVDVVQLRVADVLLYGGVGFDVVRTGASAPSGAGAFSVSALQSPTLAAGNVTFQGGRHYAVVFARSTNDIANQAGTAYVVSDTGELTEFPSAGIRYFSGSAGTVPTLDGFLLDNLPIDPAQLVPEAGYHVVAAGEHTLSINGASGATFAVTGGGLYTASFGGTGVTQVYQETPGVLRAVHYCDTQSDNVLSIYENGVPAITGVAYGETRTVPYTPPATTTYYPSFAPSGAEPPTGPTGTVGDWSSGEQAFTEQGVTLVCTQERLWTLTERGARPFPAPATGR